MKTLWAVSDLHMAVKKNGEKLDLIQPTSPDDWLIVAGDVAERTDLVLKTLSLLNSRFHTVIWVPGNHELFSRSSDHNVGIGKYQELVDGCRRMGVLTPEDPYPTFGDHTICPLFTLYDYSWRRQGVSPEQAIAEAHQRQVVFTDEFAIKPFKDPVEWCRERLRYSVLRLAQVQGPTVLINHWPLVREVMAAVFIKEIGLWSGSRHTQDWPRRYHADKVIYGHLHMPRELVVDGVTHVDVSLGYPHEWEARPWKTQWPYPVLEVR